MLEAFLQIMTQVPAGRTRQPGTCFKIAGGSVTVRAEASLSRALTAALQHLEPAPDAGLEIVAWEGEPLPIRQAPEAWRVAERWAQRQPVRAATSAGMVYFDPIGRVVTLYDARNQLGGLWVEDAAALKSWIAAAPFLRLFDAWLTPQGKFLCHGAAIARGGRAALIIGPGGAGKSTLALRSVEHGFAYVGDDYVALDPGQSWPAVYSVYSSGKLAAAEFATGIAPQFSLFREPDVEMDKVVLRVEPSAMLASAPVAIVIAPRIGDHEAGAVEPISSAEALRILLPSALQQLPGDHQAKLNSLKRMLVVPCVRLSLMRSHRHNLSLIETLLSSAPSPRELAA